MGQFGKYNDRKMKKMAEDLYEKVLEGGIDEKFNLVSTYDLNVTISDRQITIDGMQSVNGIDYEPVKQRIRRCDDEDVFEILATTYLMMKILGEQGT